MPDWEDSIRHQIDMICDDCERKLQAGGELDLAEVIKQAQEQGFRDGEINQLKSELEKLSEDYAAASKQSADSGHEFDEATIDTTAARVDTDSRGTDFETMDSATTPKSGNYPKGTPGIGDSIRYVGDYEILEEIARGGMGVVYRAKQRTLGRIVALKMILSGQLASKQEVQRFYAEAESAAALDHPGIVPIYEVGSYNDHHYFSMGLIEGPSLSSELHGEPLPISRVVPMVRKIAEAVHHAHGKGVIHRDLKPGNVLLDENDEPHITDFGLAKRHDGEDLTVSGQVLGTPAYMPPEQARGDLKQVGPVSDVYAIGAIFYSMLLGRPPYAAESAVETLRQVIDMDPPSVRSLNPSIPKDLETICLKCLSKQSAARYATAKEVAEELGRFQRGEPILARPVSRLEKSIRWAKRKPAAAALVASLLALTAILAIGGPITAITQAQLRQRAQSNERRAKLSAEQERQARDEAEVSRRLVAEKNRRNSHALYARTMALAYGQFKQGNLTGAEDSLAATDASLRGFEWDYLNRLCNSELQRFVGLTNLSGLVVMSADGNHVIAAQNGGTPTMFVWHVDGSQPITQRSLITLAFTQDGSKAITIDPKVPEQIRVIDPVSGKMLHQFKSATPAQRLATLGGPDDGLLALVTPDKHVRITELKSGKEIMAIEEPWRAKLHRVAISPDGNRIAWRRRDDNAVVIHAIPSGKRLYNGAVDPSMRDFDCPVAFSPDGQTLAVGGYEVVELRDAFSGEISGRLFGLRGHTLSLAYSPSGDRLVVTCRDGSIRVFETKQGRMIATLTGHNIGTLYGIPAATFDPSGTQIVSVGSDKIVKLWDAYLGDQRAATTSDVTSGFDRPTASQEVSYLIEPEHMVESLRFVDDGSKILCASRDQSVRLFDAQTHRELQAFEDLGDNQGCADYDSRTKRIACGGGSIGDGYPGLVKCFDVTDGEEVWSSDAARGPINRVEYFDDGQRIAVSVGSQVVARGELLVLNASDGELIWRNDSLAGAVRDMDVSNDGSKIRCVGQFNGIVTIDAQTGETLGAMGDRPYYAIDHSDDDVEIAVGGQDWSVRVFDIQSESQRLVNRRHSGAVLSVQFTASDKRLVSAALDGTTRIWDTTYGDEIVALTDDGAEKFSLAVTDDGSQIAVGGVNDTVLIRQMKNPQDSSEVTQWVELVREDFENGWSDRWEQSVGEWTVEDGRAHGRLRTNPALAILQSAAITYHEPILDDVEVEYDVRTEAEMIVETKFSDVDATNAVHALAIGIAGSPFNRGEKGGAILQTTTGVFQEIGSRRDGDFKLQPNRDYRFRTRRIGDRVEIDIDGKRYRSARVRMDVPLTRVMIHGLWGQPDDHLSIDNVVIRVPEGSEAARHATALVQERFASGTLKPLVIDELESLKTDALIGDRADLEADQVRSAAVNIAERWDQPSDEILKRIRQHAVDNDLKTQQWASVRDWIRENVADTDEETYRTLVMLAYRFGDLGNAWEMWKETHRIHETRNGYKHPTDAALEALFQQAGDQVELATDARRRLEQLVRCESLIDDETRSWIGEVRERIELPPDPRYDVLTSRVYEAMQAMWVGNDVQPLTKLLAEDAEVVVKRSANRQNAKEPRYESIYPASDYLESQELFAVGSRFQFRWIIEDAQLVQFDEKTVQVTNNCILSLPNGYQAFWMANTFRVEPEKAPSQWHVKRHVLHTGRFRLGSLAFDWQKNGWKEMDNMIEQETDASRKARLLMISGRSQEALKLTNKICQSSESQGHHILRASAAWSACQPQIIRDAVRKLVQMPRQLGGPPMVHHYVAKGRLGDAIELPSNVSIRVPEFYHRGPTQILGAGENGLAIFRPEEDTLLAVLRGDHSELSKGVDEAIALREKAFGVKLLDRHSLNVDGFPAETFTTRGMGTGWAVGGGTIPTVQRFVLIDRGTDIVTLLISSEESAFTACDSELEVILNHLNLKARETE